MNITRDQFVQIINACIEQIDRDHEIAEALDVVARDGANRSLVFSTRLIDKVVSAIDYEDMISWWLWDGPEAGKRAEERAIYLGDIDEPFSEKIVINNAGELYDYIEQQNPSSTVHQESRTDSITIKRYLRTDRHTKNVVKRLKNFARNNEA